MPRRDFPTLVGVLPRARGARAASEHAGAAGPVLLLDERMLVHGFKNPLRELLFELYVTSLVGSNPLVDQVVDVGLLLLQLHVHVDLRDRGSLLLQVFPYLRVRRWREFKVRR